MQLIFDGHNDVLLRLWHNSKTGADSVAEFMKGTKEGHMDAPRCKAAVWLADFVRSIFPRVIWF